MNQFEQVNNEYNYLFQQRLDAKATTYCEIPRPTTQQRGVKHITWQVQSDVKVYATLSENRNGTNTVWEEVSPNSQLSPCVTALKFVSSSSFKKKIIVRVIME